MAGEGGQTRRVPWILLFPIIAFCQLCFAAMLPHVLDRQVYEVIEDEELLYVQRFGRDLVERSRYNGDRLYDLMLVETGVERAIYAFAAPQELPEREELLPGEARFAEAWVGGATLDAIFDYILLMCYRLGVTSIFLIFAGVLLATLVVHSMVDRRRRRYVFGDTDILQNAYARATTALALPVAFAVASLPVALAPLIVVSLVALCGASAAFVVLSLPKKT